MKYGLIGGRLGHSFSKEVHAMLADYDYEIREIPKDELDAFMTTADFNAINVTIPYKEAVIPYLSYISDEARAIGAVNTIVKKDGKLFGYNTDFLGMTAQIHKMNLNLKGKKTVILGTGGTSKTAYAVAKSLGASPIITVSRTKKHGAVDYDELYTMHTDAEVIINTTPVGMYPDNFSSPVDISCFARLEGVIDAIYNPIRTKLVIDAKKRGIIAEGGLYMLVAQAVYASEIFIGVKHTEEKLDSIFREIKCDKENIVLIGMPTSGKSTVAKIIGDKLSRQALDTDTIVEESKKTTISDIFLAEGESVFRDCESEAVALVSKKNGTVIATGGGAVLRSENVDMLKQNGVLFFIDRPFECLIPTADRPLAADVEAIKKRYAERYKIYCTSADTVIDANATAEAVAEKIMGAFHK